jgi:hypothetical protein
MSLGRPVSALTLGYGTDALYSEGVVCFIDQSHVHIVDLYGARDRQSITVDALLGPVSSLQGKVDYHAVQLLSYCASILVLHYETADTSHWLLAVDISDPYNPRPVIERERLRSSNKLFVRQTKDFLFYGTHSVYGSWCSRRYREWYIQGIALTQEHKFSISDMDGHITKSSKSEPIQLHSFAGSEIGSTVCFKIHEGFFYALTNCDAFDVIEVDFTSYYHCVRFPVAHAQQSTCHAARQIYRRQHAEGPLNDGWNALRLCVDERTNELFIVEGRAEWSLGSGTLSRGYYVQNLNFDEQNIEPVQERQLHIGPANDPLSKIPDDETKYSQTPELPPWHRHLESAHDARTELQPGLAIRQTLTPTLARSKYRTYDLTSMCSLELFEQRCSCRGSDAYCLQLCSASRRPKPLIPIQDCNGVDMKGKRKSTALEQVHVASKHSSDPYRYSTTSFWPQRDIKLHEIMNLPEQLQNGLSTEVKAWADERCVVYFIHTGGVGKVVCLNFDEYAPVMRYNDVTSNAPLQVRRRGRSTHQQSDPEHLRQLSPLRQPFDHAIFNPEEAKPACFVSTWDLEGIPDAEQLDVQELEEWFDLLGGGKANAVSCL